MSLSLSKNLQIGINDIREFINISKENKDHINLKEIFKLTSNQNLSELKKNKDWTNDIIERLGMYISQRYDSLEQFFNEYSQPGTGKFKYEDFLRFQDEHFDLFKNGFNLSNDEILSLYSSLDSQKKNYLTLQDLKNKLQIFNYYTKMHIDIKHFIQQNFMNGVDAFKFFMKQNNNGMKKEDEEENKDEKRDYITLKEMFDAFEHFFPKKYSTNTILKYLNKFFNITIPNDINYTGEKKDKVNYEEFNYIFFDKIEGNKSFLEKKSNKVKLLTNRIALLNKMNNNKKKFQRSSSSFFYSNLFQQKSISLSTPFDDDPLNKIKRIIFSSKHNLNKLFEAAALECDNNNLLVNKNQFKNIIRSLNIGITNLEIDQIISKCNKIGYDGKINMREFIKYLRGRNPLLEEGNNNISSFIGEIKSLIYKYYGNPIICFQNNDSDHSGKIDFEKFKNIIFDMFGRNNQQIPNFILIKNAYDTLDLRKDGIIDIKEWCIAFASYNGKLDVDSEKISNGPEFFNNKLNFLKKNKSLYKLERNRISLREWETSGDIMDIYLFIYKNRKNIKDKIFQSDYVFNCGKAIYVQADNLLNIIRDLFPNNKLNQMQWKMIVNIAQSENNNNLIEIDKFFKILEMTSKNLTSHPKIKINQTMSKSIGISPRVMKEKKLRTIDTNTSLQRRFNFGGKSDKQKVNTINLVNFGNVVLPSETKKNH
jgi:Ca2+-binding EF-hand superfamily protein